MQLLKVPYTPQFNINACGAAVLEMVYKYYGLKKVSQEEILTKYQELEPHGSGNFRITTDNLIQDARTRGFISGWARANYSNELESTALLRILVGEMKIPIIVCQKFTETQPLIGHFRIVLGIDGESVYFHDPSAEIGGPNIQWPISKFIDFWQKTGDNVTGGIFCFIAKRPRSMKSVFDTIVKWVSSFL
jgi:predicted double-glycine peptidase